MQLPEWLEIRRKTSILRQTRRHRRILDRAPEQLESRALLATLSVTNANDAGAGSLREAITLSNASVADDDVIEFAIPGAGPHVISLQSGLPAVADTVTIDGWSQPGFQSSPLVVLDGTQAGNVSGLNLRASDSIVRGLVVQNFARSGIQIQDAADVEIYGNNIGVESNGLTPAGNGEHGISLSADSLQGENPVLLFMIDTSGSVLAQFSGSAVGDVNSDGLSDTIIDASIAGLVSAVESLIEQGRGSSVAIGVDSFDMDLVAPGVQLTTFPSADTNGNGVSDVIDILYRMNTRVDGVNYDPFHPDLRKAVTFFQTQNTPVGDGNLVVVSDGYIGVSTQAIADLDSLGVRRRGIAVGASSNLGTMQRIDPAAVQVASTDELRDAALSIIAGGGGIANMTVGSTAQDHGNVIAFNGLDGVQIDSPGAIGNTISGNQIHSNGELGIDLGPDGVTLNDFDDSDDGTNGLSNYPRITSVVEVGGRTFVRGIVQAIPNTEYRVELFRNASAESSGFGEGERFLTSLQTTTDAGGTGAFSYEFNGLLQTGFITGTATDPRGNTSEFSKARPVDPADPFADLVIDYDPRNVSQLVYLNDENIDVALGSQMPPNPFTSRGTAESLASIIDAPSARAIERHQADTRVWTGIGRLELEFDFRQDYQVTTLHFWNCFEEISDADSISVSFFDSNGERVGDEMTFHPQLGGNGRNPISAEDFDLSLPDPVRRASVVVQSSNGEVDFTNIGFTAVTSTDSPPTNTNSTDPGEALEAPDFPPSGAPGQPGSVALGHGGLLNLEFVDNRLINTGDGQFDLQIYEADSEAEATIVAIRPTPATSTLLSGASDPDGDGFLEIGRVGGGLTYLDIDAAFPGYGRGVLVFDAVQLIDDTGQGPATGDTAGADVDAVVALEFEGIAGDFVVSQTGINTVVSEAGRSDTFSIQLTTQPEATVVIHVDPGPSGEISVDKSEVTFSPADWDVPQVLTVIANDDFRDDGDQVAFVEISVDSTTPDRRYAVLPDKEIPVLIEDNDDVGVRLSKTQALVSESGTTDIVEVVLDAQPEADVVISLASDDTDEVILSAAMITFTQFDWNIPQQFQVTGVDDSNTDGDQMIPVSVVVQADQSDNQYDDLPDQEVLVTVSDDDSAGLVVVQSDGSTSSRESGSPDSFLVKLTTQPLENVLIEVSSLDESVARVSLPTVLLTPSNWNAGISVDVEAVDDVFVDGTDFATVMLSVVDEESDDFYDDVPDQSFQVETTDDDEPGFIISHPAVTVAEDGVAELTVILTSAPLSDVVINVSSSDESEAEVSQTQLIFTPDNWGDPHLVEVKGVRDFIVDTSKQLSLLFTIDDDISDAEFAPLAPQTVDVEVIDSDVPGFRYSHTGGNTTVAEFGAADTFTVVLNSQPETNVVIGILSADGTEMSVSRRRLTFTPGNWDVPQVVTVTGEDDAIIDGDVVSGIILTVEDHNSSSTFSEVPDQTVSVRNIDNDVPGIVLSKATASVDEVGQPDTFFVTLASRPQSNVVLTVESGDTGEVTLSTQTLNFLPSTWNVPRAITLFPVVDNRNDGNQSTNVDVAVVPESSDDNFDALGARTVVVLSLDNDLSRVVGPVGTIFDTRPSIEITSIADAESYEIWLEKIGGDSNPIVNPTITSNTFQLPENLDGGRYRTWVRANLLAGGQTTWNVAEFTVSIAPVLSDLPGPGDDLRPTLSWSPVPGAISYRAYANNLTSGAAAIIDQTVTSLEFTPSTNLGFGRHRFWVQAIGSGFRAWSTAVDYYVGPRPVTPVESTFSVRPTLNWTTMADVASHQLYVSGRDGVVLNASGLPGTSFDIPFDLENGRYRWWVRPTHTSGRVGNWSAVSELHVGGQPQIVAPASDDASGRPTFEWSPISGASSFELYFYNQDTRTIVHRETGYTANSWTSFPIPDGNYRFWVRSYNSNGDAALWSRAKNVVVRAATVAIVTTASGPLGPTFDRTPTFEWTADAGAASYDLILYNDVQSIIRNGLSVSTWTPSEPLHAGPWQWAVRSRDSSGAAGPWAFASADTSARPVLIAPIGNASSDRPEFRWSTVEGAARYVLQVDNLSTSESSVILEEGLTSTSFVPAGVLPAGEYRVWVRAISSSAGPPSPWSIQQDFIVVDSEIEAFDSDLKPHIPALTHSANADLHDEARVWKLAHRQSDVEWQDPRMNKRGTLDSEVEADPIDERAVDRLMVDSNSWELTM